MSIMINLPKPNVELVNHLLTEENGIGALDATQGKVLSDRLNTLETITIRDQHYNDRQAVNMLHDYWNQLKIGTYTVLLITSGGTWRANIYKHSDHYGDYILSSYFRLDTTYKAPLIGKILNGQWFDYGELALKSDLTCNQYTLTVNGDATIYYPVVFPFIFERSIQLEITKYVHAPVMSSGALRAKFEYTISGWGGYMSFVKNRYCLWSENFIANTKLGSQSVGNFTVWLKGGGIPYTITDNINKGEGIVYYEKINLSHNTKYPYYVEPRTTIDQVYQTQIQP